MGVRALPRCRGICSWRVPCPARGHFRQMGDQPGARAVPGLRGQHPRWQATQGRSLANWAIAPTGPSRV